MEPSAEVSVPEQNPLPPRTKVCFPWTVGLQQGVVEAAVHSLSGRGSQRVCGRSPLTHKTGGTRLARGASCKRVQ